MDYILGANPQQRSYMVGFGNNFPTQPHHRGASNPVLPLSEEVSCAKTFIDYFTKNAPNPNELTGAIVGGQSFNFLKKGDTTDLGYGFVARHVGKFSGCSIHSLCKIPLDFSFSERFRI